jgi:DNA-binding NarL/FixJ family response regulator
MRVLVLEDIPETQAWLVGVVGKAFPEAASVAVDKRAAGVVAAKAQAFDLALIDLGLPDGSGLDVLREVKVKNPEALCVVTTILNDDGHILAALSVGAEGYLLKD